ncbi:MAG: DNA recombination protein RmuC [Acidobacteria bacterium]|nr:DNA recombination protein RmuC [Acidobacteriota bacterium]
MIVALIALQILALLALLALLFHRPTAAQQPQDPRLTQLLASDLPTQFTHLDARSQALDQHLRAELSHLRGESANASAALRNEVLGNISTLGETLRSGLANFRADNTAEAVRLKTSVDAQLNTLNDRLTRFVADYNRHQTDSREALHGRLDQLGAAQTAHQDQLRSAVETRLDTLNRNNEKKLDEMRQTVDEKLHTTLQTRLTESFGQVTDQLTKVHAGLGEMTKLSAGVDDLSRIFTNVKSRGQFAEAMLDNLLKQMLAPSQFIRNAQVRPGTQEVVEFAIRFPGINGEVLLPIDSKFPRETADRLESAYESGNSADIATARKAFDNAIRTEAKRICSKYINEPITTPHAIMFLPTEGLYAEVMRRDGLHDDIQQQCHVMIAGPGNLSAILTSFQMVFALVNLQKKGGEVWNVLATARTEFDKFGGLMDKMDKQVGTVQNTIREIGTRTRAINKTLKDVSKDAADVALPSSSSAGFDGFLPMLAASDDV